MSCKPEWHFISQSGRINSIRGWECKKHEARKWQFNYELSTAEEVFIALMLMLWHNTKRVKTRAWMKNDLVDCVCLQKRRKKLVTTCDTELWINYNLLFWLQSASEGSREEEEVVNEYHPYLSLVDLSRMALHSFSGLFSSTREYLSNMRLSPSLYLSTIDTRTLMVKYWW